MCRAENWLVNQEGHVTPLTNKGLLFGIIKGNQWLIRPYFLGGISLREGVGGQVTNFGSNPEKKGCDSRNSRSFGLVKCVE